MFVENLINFCGYIGILINRLLFVRRDRLGWVSRKFDYI